MRRDEPATCGNTIADELQSVVLANDVDPLAILLDGLIRLRRERGGGDQHRLRCKRRKTRIKMVEARVAQLEWDHFDSQFFHRNRELFNSAWGGAETITGPNFRSIGMPQ